MTQKEKQLVEYGMLKGMLDMAWNLAIWKNGTPVVSVAEKPFKDFAKPMQEDMEELRILLKMSDCEIMSCKGCPDCKASKSLHDVDLEEY